MYEQNGYIYFLEICTICRKTCSASITTMKNFPFHFLLPIFVSMVTPPLLPRGIFYIRLQKNGYKIISIDLNIVFNSYILATEVKLFLFF